MTGPARGEREMTIAELNALVEELKKNNQPFHNPVMEIQKKFSIPVACFVFTLLGVGLGVSNRKDGRLASFVLGIAVIFVYYVVMFTAESMAKGAIIPAWSAMWMPNLVLGLAGMILVVARSRGVETTVRLNVPALGFRRRSGATDAVSDDSTAKRQRGGTVIVIRIPQFNLPRPNLLN